MKYLIEIDNTLYGYETAAILRINIAENKPESYRLFMKADQMVTRYDEITLDELKGMD